MFQAHILRATLATGIFLLSNWLFYTLGAHSRVSPIVSKSSTSEDRDDIPSELQYLTQSIDLAKEKRREVLTFLKQPVINDFNVTYKVTQGWKCKNSIPKTIIIVPSARQNFSRRQRFRKGPIANYTMNNPDAVYVFFVGFGHDAMGELDEEIQTCNDIVLNGFGDTYRNILLKHVSMINWVLHYCPGTEFVLRFDDDVGLKSDLESVIKALERHRKSRTNFILGTQRVGALPNRELGWRNTLTTHEYTSDVFPPFVLGGAMGYPLSTGRLLYQAARRMKTIWLDDVFITGICAEAVGIPTFNDVNLRFDHF